MEKKGKNNIGDEFTHWTERIWPTDNDQTFPVDQALFYVLDT